MLRKAALTTLLLVFSLCLRAQTISDCRQYTVIVNALEAHGIPIRGLSINNFRASSRGRELNILSSQFTENSTGRIVVLLDASGSMRGEHDPNKWKIALTAASEFMTSAPDRQQISLITFADRVKENFHAAERQAIVEWLRSPAALETANVKGQTALYDSILDALKGLEPAQPGDSIYVITDGGDNKSSETMSRLDHKLQTSGSRLFVFLLDDAVTEEENLGARDLYELTHRSGGFLVSVSPHKFGPTVTGSYDYDNKVLTAIRTSTRITKEEIGNYYVLGVQPQNRVSRPENWKLEAVDAQGRKRKDVSLAYPNKLPGCVLQSAER
jgi:Mg-chelatase subunit ChlD